MSFAGARMLRPPSAVAHCTVEKMVEQDIQASIDRNLNYITKYRLAELPKPKPNPVLATLAILPNLLLAFVLIWLDRLLPDDD